MNRQQGLLEINDSQIQSIVRVCSCKSVNTDYYYNNQYINIYVLVYIMNITAVRIIRKLLQISTKFLNNFKKKLKIRFEN